MKHSAMLPRVLSIVLVCSCLFLEAHETNAQLTTHIEVNQAGSVFSYTVFNNEADSQHVSTFYLMVNAPITVTNTPVGWDFVTDNNTFVNWFCTDTEAPYPHDIAPRSSLSGFAIKSALSENRVEALTYAVTFWDHDGDMPGAGMQDFITVPSAEAILSTFLPNIQVTAPQ